MQAKRTILQALQYLGVGLINQKLDIIGPKSRKEYKLYSVTSLCKLERMA